MSDMSSPRCWCERQRHGGRQVTESPACDARTALSRRATGRRPASSGKLELCWSAASASDAPPGAVDRPRVEGGGCRWRAVAAAPAPSRRGRRATPGRARGRAPGPRLAGSPPAERRCGACCTTPFGVAVGRRAVAFEPHHVQPIALADGQARILREGIGVRAGDQRRLPQRTPSHSRWSRAIVEAAAGGAGRTTRWTRPTLSVTMS